eukprot:jgi/Bigna1/91440/estExt_fgenesh1_pg.C_1010005
MELLNRLSAPLVASFFLLFAARCEAQSLLSPASLQEREFPADLPFEDWNLSDERVANYIQDLIVHSGGVGLAIGLIFTITMVGILDMSHHTLRNHIEFSSFFHMCCWGMCCNCCRCCCFRKEKVRQWPCSKPDMRKYLMVLQIYWEKSFIIKSPWYDNVNSLFDDAVLSVQEAEDFVCSGQLPISLRSGQTLDDLREAAGGNTNILRSCGESSVGNFLFQVNSQINGTVDEALLIIDNLQQILILLDQSVEAIDNATLGYERQLDSINQLDLNTTQTEAEVSTLAGLGLFDVPTVDYNEVDNQDRINTIAAIQGTQVARYETKSSCRFHLYSKVRNELQQERNNILSDVDELQEQLLNSVAEMVSAESDIEDGQENTSGNETIVESVAALVYSISLICLLIMLVGYLLKRKWVMSVGAYIIFGLFIWMTFFFGLTLVSSMVFYDVCGCEGDYSIESCNTLNTIFTTNVRGTTQIGSSSVDLGETANQIVTCQSEFFPNGTYILDPETNFVDILGVIQVCTICLSTTRIELAESEAAFDPSPVQNGVNATLVVLELSILEASLLALQADLNSPLWTTFYSTTSPPDAATVTDNDNALLLIPSIQNRVSHQILVVTIDNDINVRIPAESAEQSARLSDAIGFLIAVDTTLIQAQDDLRAASDSLLSVVDFTLTVNRFTPCNFVGNACNALGILSTGGNARKADLSPRADCIDYQNEQKELENDVKDLVNDADDVKIRAAARQYSRTPTAIRMERRLTPQPPVTPPPAALVRKYSYTKDHVTPGLIVGDGNSVRPITPIMPRAAGDRSVERDTALFEVNADMSSASTRPSLTPRQTSTQQQPPSYQDAVEEALIFLDRHERTLSRIDNFKCNSPDLSNFVYKLARVGI